MLLAVDIGNTNINLGVWDDETLRREWRLQTSRVRTADEYGILLIGMLREEGLDKKITNVILASVVPILTQTFTQLCRNTFRIDPLIVTANLEMGIDIRTDNPSEVGADRLVNAAAAHHIYKRPCIIIDMGTATTFDVVSANGELLGVVIAPGLRLAADALISQAAQLSQVPLNAPPQAIGRNTVHAIQSGLIFGYVAMIEGMIQRLVKEHPNQESEILVLGTGGLISLITPHTDIINYVDPSLTLSGLRIIHQRVSR